MQLRDKTPDACDFQLVKVNMVCIVFILYLFPEIWADNIHSFTRVYKAIDQLF